MTLVEIDLYDCQDFNSNLKKQISKLLEQNLFSELPETCLKQTDIYLQVPCKNKDNNKHAGHVASGYVMWAPKNIAQC